MSDTLPPLPGARSGRQTPSNIGQRMEITIHVCDEAKNSKKDFTCPRDLLLNEMKYFQDYLSPNTEKWDDVDISVHCDIKIFDWLIKYVKRDDNDIPQPVLDINNVVSILISSDFLKMDNLVGECIKFCHDNLSAIITTPCNMNCINDNLVTRLAVTFNQNSLEHIKDKKDKFKSKLFCKLIERSFDENSTDEYSPNNAYKLFKCLHCEKLLLPSISNLIECTSARTSLDSRGNISYNHSRDANWNTTEYLLAIKRQVKTWRNVYWRLWSVVNFLRCRICQCVFSVCDFKACLYHPKLPIMRSDGQESELKYYPCCDQAIVPFESIPRQTGCEHRNHKIDFSHDDNSNVTITNGNSVNMASGNSNSIDMDFLTSPVVYNELLNVIDTVCIEKAAVIPSCPTYYDIAFMMKDNQNPISKNERFTETAKESGHRKERKRSPTRKALVNKKRPNSSKQKSKVDPVEEDDDADEQGIVRVVIHQKDSSSLMKNNKRTWSDDLPLRLNQDMQRESDLKRMNQLIHDLRLNRGNRGNDDVTEYKDGGIFDRLETRMRMNLLQSQITTSNSISTANSSNRRGKYAER